MKNLRLIALCGLLACNVLAFGIDGPTARRGILDARNYDFSASSLKLNGEWVVVREELLGTSQMRDKATYTSFPEVWAHTQGMATYRLVVIANTQYRDYVLEMPQLYSAYMLWCNGVQVASNGVVGGSRATNKPQWLPKLASLSSGTDTLEFVLQVANFNHAIGGLKNPILLGLKDDLAPKRALAVVVNQVLLYSLGLFGFIFLGIYFLAKKEKIVLYFSLMCLVWAIRSVFSELYLAIEWMPNLDWELAVKIEYLTIFLEAVFAMLFVAGLYPHDTNRLVKNTLVYPNYLFVLFTMATPAIVFTKFLNVYLAVAGLVIAYVIVVVIRAIVFERYGARFGVLGILSGIGAFSYNILSYLGLFEFNPILYHTFYVITFTSMGFALAYQLSPNASKRNEPDRLRFEDFMMDSDRNESGRLKK
jgi:7TM diverse intracellular signalling